MSVSSSTGGSFWGGFGAGIVGGGGFGIDIAVVQFGVSEDFPCIGHFNLSSSNVHPCHGYLFDIPHAFQHLVVAFNKGEVSTIVEEMMHQTGRVDTSLSIAELDYGIHASAARASGPS